MADAAISAERVSKRFRLYHDRNQTLKAAVVRGRRARYEDFWALKDVSFEIERGETFGIIGPNGSGKSTMLKCLSRILRPEEGTIEVRGSMSSLLELGAGFHPELSGRENVYLNAAILGLTRKQVDARFDEIVSFAGLERFIDMPVKNYSSGMYVRLGFAVAINVDPEILLIDEVLAVGDEAFQRKSAEKIAEFRDSHRTVVIVSHGLAPGAGAVRPGGVDRGGQAGHGRAPPPRSWTRTQARPTKTATPLLQARRAGAPARCGSPKVELLDGDGQPARRIRSGDRMVVHISFNAPPASADPIFGISIEHVDGTPSRAPTHFVRARPSARSMARARSTSSFPRSLWPEGTYDFSVAIADRTSAMIRLLAPAHPLRRPAR